MSKTLVTQLEDFIYEVEENQKIKKVYFMLENGFQNHEVKNEKEEVSLVTKVTSIFRLTAISYDYDLKMETWFGCNILLANEIIQTKEEGKEIGDRVDKEKIQILKTLKDRLVRGGIILREGVVLLGGKE